MTASSAKSKSEILTFPKDPLQLDLSAILPRIQSIQVLKLTTGNEKALHLELADESFVQVLRILNVILKPRKASLGEGFPALRELVLASVDEGIYIDDSLLFAMAGCSNHLRVLDLRGSNRVTPQGLMALPSEELVELYLGICGPFKLSFRTRIGWARDSSSVLRRWGGSLLSLDLTGQAVTDAEVVEIIHLGRGSNLRHLALGGTQITEHILSSILKNCPQLRYLNLTGCRCLPRDLKRVYDGPESLQDLLTRLEK
uniref:Uncharacterized protein n=1 Tax=Eptatretus burgeri TaxID=7764 RepID=A0A8C4R4U9_EPTBU